MSILSIANALIARNITPVERLTYIYILDGADSQGVARVDTQELAIALEVTERTIKDVIHRLHNRSFLQSMNSGFHPAYGEYMTVVVPAGNNQAERRETAEASEEG